MMPLLLPLLLGLQAPSAAQEPKSPAPAPVQAPAPAPTPAPAPAPKAQAPEPLKPLSFQSQRFKYYWDRLIPLDLEVDGLKLNSIFFNRREIRSGLFKGAEFGTRAEVEVTNTSRKPRIPGFAVAVFDADGKLLGATSGGTKLGTIPPGKTETFQMNFHQVLERLPKGDTFVISVELRDH